MRLRKQRTQDTLPTGLASPARRALAAAGISRLEQFGRISEADLLGLHGMGPKAIQTIREAMAKRGLTFARATAKSGGVSEAANRRIRRRPITRR
jgi:DNA-directed RNA polymerase alpha subunit